MNNLPVNSSRNLPVQERTTELNLSGGNNNVVFHANNVIHNYMLPCFNPKAKLNEISSQLKINPDFYHLFVQGIERFEKGYFYVAKDRVFEYTNDELRKKYASLTPKTIEELKHYPAIFANENHEYGRTDDLQDAYFGFVTDIKVQDNGIKIYYSFYKRIQQQLLNENSFEFGIWEPKSFNELNRMHWALKQINVIEALQEIGINLLE